MLRILFGLTVLAVSSPVLGQHVDANALYEKKCKICHSLNGVGGKKADLGGPLDGVGTKRTEEWLRAYIADPKSQFPDGKMPKLKLSEAELDALVALMLEWK